MANSVDPDQTIGAVCSGSTLFASILNSSIMLGNYLQQTTSDGALRVKSTASQPACHIGPLSARLRNANGVSVAGR